MTLLEEVRALAQEIWREYYPGIIAAEQIEYMLERMYALDVLARDQRDGVRFEIVGDHEGFAGYGPFAPGVWKLHKLYLKVSARGKGLGQRALAHVEDVCRQAGAEKLILTVNKRNARAIAAYERAGFVREGVLVADIGGGFVMDDYVYGKVINQQR